MRRKESNSAALNEAQKEKRRCSDSSAKVAAASIAESARSWQAGARTLSQFSAPPAEQALRDFFFSTSDDFSDPEHHPSRPIPSKWPPRKHPSAPLRRTSPLAPRSARVRHPETALNATCDHHPRQWARKPQQETCTNNTLQASSSSALPASSPPSTTPSSTSPIFRTSEHRPPRNREFERKSGNWQSMKNMVQRLTWVIPVAVRPSPVSPVA